jgi:hypothetical protein
MQDFAAGAFGLGDEQPKKKQESMPAYSIGRPYLPSTAKVDELKSMTLADLKMETHHKGKVLTLKRVSPVVELSMSSWAVVQGENAEDVERIELFLHRKRDGSDWLEMVSEFQVKEPYFTLNDRDEPTIRVDHPSDLIVLSIKESEDDWRGRKLTGKERAARSLLDCKQLGNTALGKKEYAQARAFLKA